MSQTEIAGLEGKGAYRAAWSETSEEGVSRFTLCTFKGNQQLSLRVVPAQGDGITLAVENPARYGMTRRPENMTEFMAIARAFVSERP